MQRVALAAPPALGEAGRLPRTRHFWGSKASDGWPRRPRWVAQTRVTHPELCPLTCPLPCHLSLPPTEVVLQAHTSLSRTEGSSGDSQPLGFKTVPPSLHPPPKPLGSGAGHPGGGRPLCAAVCRVALEQHSPPSSWLSVFRVPFPPCRVSLMDYRRLVSSWFISNLFRALGVTLLSLVAFATPPSLQSSANIINLLFTLAFRSLIKTLNKPGMCHFLSNFLMSNCQGLSKFVSWFYLVWGLRVIQTH